MQASRKNGLLAAILTFTIWGLVPLYWRALDSVGAGQIVAHRIWWAFVAMLLLVCLLGLRKEIWLECREVCKHPKKLLLIIAAACLVSFNWLIYVWAVNDGRVLQTSLGYYINPLLNVLLGVLFLQERMIFWQKVSVGLAALGVLNMAVNFGSLPWVSLALAFSMGLYGFCKKKLHLGVFTSMTIETAILMPFAICYIIYTYDGSYFVQGITYVELLLFGTGPVTVLPLLLFSHAANILPLSVLGLTQYLSPTIAFIIGVFFFKETFTTVHLVSFCLIWSALLLFSFANSSLLLGLQSKLKA